MILGAGASRGALGECAPTSAEFGRYVCCKVCKGEEDFRKKFPNLSGVLEFLRERIPRSEPTAKCFGIDNWPLDKVWGAMDTRWKLHDIIGQRGYGDQTGKCTEITKNANRTTNGEWDYAGFELRYLTTKVYGSGLECALKKAVKCYCGSCNLKSVFKELSPGDSVISFNYDILAEKMLDACWKKWTVACPNTLKKDTHILLSKPHGSLTWKQYSRESPRKGLEIQLKPMSENEYRYDPQIDATCQPGIIGPVPYKSEIIFPEYQRSVPMFYRYLVAQWKELIDYVSKADKLIVCGYSFPVEDYHARYLFAEAAARRNGNGKKLDIEVYSQSGNTLENVRQIFGNDIDCLCWKGKIESCCN